MPFNVCDKNGNHIGFIAAQYPEYFNVFMVAVTEQKIDDDQVDINAIKNKLAEIYGCKNMIGKINDEKLQRAITMLLEGNYSYYKNLSSTDFLKFLSLKSLRDIEKFIKYDKENISGYVLVDIDKLHFKNGTAVMDETIDYISDTKPDKDAPIYAKIIDYPIITTNIMGIGEGLILGADFSDFGGRNHTHCTSLNLLSGNFTTKTELPAIIYAKKDMTVNLYMNNNKIRKVFCDGIIYEF
ncbi:MAG TPA: hypothetical protein DEF85_03225 [Clostridiaceae bacterium]|jgi:hypothetical protein|nr:hypothetical protein [Clostridiaceae bacterium]HBG38995.1 hypothetical protein [Clostridiaceae bacterium]HBN28428.1 hypothetical protein [Clostridiaceae bacterium]HBX47884.1 hypothetical protein [Clostridiaceae bacterium]HCL50516.1 hypothetical protein [Clostridiaceae bacterium]